MSYTGYPEQLTVSRKFDVKPGGEFRLAGVQVTATAGDLNLVTGAATAVGTPNGATVTATESGTPPWHVTQLDLSSTAVTITEDSTAGYGSVLLYTYPSGIITLARSMATLSVDVSGSANISNTGSGDISLGSTAVGGAALDDWEEIQALGSRELTDPFVAGVGSTTDYVAFGDSFWTDGTNEVHLNLIFDTGDVSGAGSALVTGRIVLLWANLGALS